MSVEQFSEFDWNSESTLVIVLFWLFTSLSFFRSSGSQHGVIGVTGGSNGTAALTVRLPLFTSSIALRS